jgi:hypothetical protein
MDLVAGSATVSTFKDEDRLVQQCRYLRIARGDTYGARIPVSRRRTSLSGDIA